MTPTHFDIYVRQGGRWQRQETISGDDKDAAILFAAELDKNGGFDGVRAMAVVEYGAGRPPLETLAWISPHLNKTAAVKRQMENSAAAAGKSVAARDNAEESLDTTSATQLVTSFVDDEKTTGPVASKAEKKADTDNRQIRAAGKIAGAGAIALAITAVLFVPVSSLIKGGGARLGLEAAAIQNTTFATMVLIFIVAAAVLMSRVYREYRELMEQVAAEEPRPARRAQPTRQVQSRSEKPRSPEAPPVPSAQPDVAEAGQSVAAKHATGDAAETQANSVEETAGLTQQMRRAVLEFLARSLSAIKDEVPRMNQHVIFGLNLFGAGAAERYGEHAGLRRFQSFVLVREMIGALGNSEERIDAFCRNYEEYRAEERFRMMINAGRYTMGRSISGDPDPFEDFADVVKMWTSDAAARAQSQGIVCILFTDLVGSTQMTHERGDHGAQEIVRIHNAIVRTALAAHHGKEVKHTGDGIMASFSSAANAVRATIEIRQALVDHNGRDNALPVRVRMGLNAGEALQEEDDFFGTTVQLAARVCDKADEGEIFVTDNVRELSKGQGIEVEEAGQFEMKGVPEPMTLYKVVVSAT